jgi:hypothetical protein
MLTMRERTPYAFVKAIFEIARSKGLIYVHGRPDRLNTSSDGHPQSLHIQLRDRNAQLKETIVPCDGLVVSAGPWTSHVLEALGLPILPVGSAGGHSITIQIPPGQKISPTAVFASIHGVNRRPRMDASGRMVFSTARTTEAPELFPRPDGTVFVAGEDDELHPPDDPADVDESTNAEMAARLMRATRYVSGVLAGGVVLKKEVGLDICLPFQMLRGGDLVVLPTDDLRRTTNDREAGGGRLRRHRLVVISYGMEINQHADEYALDRTRTLGCRPLHRYRQSPLRAHHGRRSEQCRHPSALSHPFLLRS